MTIDVASVATGDGRTGAGGAFTLAMPTGNGSGDVLLARVMTYGTDSVPAGWPAGWFSIVGAGTGVVVRHDAFWKRLTGAESDFSINAAHGSAGVGYQYVVERITGAHASQAPEGVSAVGVGLTPDPPTLTPPGLTPTWGAELGLWGVSYGAASTGSTASVWPDGYDEDQYTHGSNTCAIATANQIATLESDDPTAFTKNAVGAWVALTIAIRGGGVAPVEPSLGGGGFYGGPYRHPTKKDISRLRRLMGFDSVRETKRFIRENPEPARMALAVFEITADPDALIDAVLGDVPERIKFDVPVFPRVEVRKRKKRTDRILLLLILAAMDM